MEECKKAANGERKRRIKKSLEIEAEERRMKEGKIKFRSRFVNAIERTNMSVCEFSHKI